MTDRFPPAVPLTWSTAGAQSTDMSSTDPWTSTSIPTSTTADNWSSAPLLPAAAATHQTPTVPVGLLWHKISEGFHGFVQLFQSHTALQLGRLTLLAFPAKTVKSSFCQFLC